VEGKTIVDIRRAMAMDLTDALGASRILSHRFGRPFSVDSVHQLVKQGRLRAFLFQEGELVERQPETQTKGKDLLFLRADLYSLEPPKRPGRPSGKPEKETEHALDKLS